MGEKLTKRISCVIIQRGGIERCLYFEAVYELAHDAVSEGVIAPSISSGFYLQGEIWDVLKWAKYRALLKTNNVEGQNRFVLSS